MHSVDCLSFSIGCEPQSPKEHAIGPTELWGFLLLAAVLRRGYVGNGATAMAQSGDCGCPFAPATGREESPLTGALCYEQTPELRANGEPAKSSLLTGFRGCQGHAA